MAQVFIQTAPHHSWVQTHLTASSYVVENSSPSLLVAGPPAGSLPTLIRLPSTASQQSWVCLAANQSNHVRVNGDPVVGLRLLADRDILEIRGRRMIFSSEEIARIEAYSGPAGVCCPRCKTPLDNGKPVVRCPGCGTFHHADPERELPCWSYSPECAVCRWKTVMDSNLQWTPESL